MKAPTMDPTTIPAIAPPERPLLRETGAAAGLVDGLGAVVAAAVVKATEEAEAAMTGNTMPLHLVSVLEYTQHESVALGELVAQ